MPGPANSPSAGPGDPTRSPAGASDGDRRTPWRERSRLLRGSVYAAVTLVLALVAASVFAVMAVRNSFPQTDGTIDVPGLTGEVTVIRDELGVPQIYADTAEELFFAQGFVQAQDRFFEMDVRRHITAGRLSEMFGEQTLETDKVVRAMGWRRIAEEEVKRLDPTTVSYLEAFSAGVNAYVSDRSTGELSLEYTLLALGGLDDYAVESWTPADSVAWLKAIAWDLRGNMQDEIDRAMASTTLSPEQIEELYPPYPFDRHRPIVDEPAAGTGAVSTGSTPERTSANRDQPDWDPAGAEAGLEAVDRALDAVPPLVGAGDGVGSNAWVVDGERSTTGMPILANDPHLAPTLPGVWYQMGLHCNEVDDDCPFDVAGFTFAGVPGVIIGHNQEIAWGFTNLGPDVTDLYLEAVDGDRYRRGDGWRGLRHREETIEVAGGEPFTFTVRSTVHGPLLSDVAPSIASVGANAPVRGDSPERSEGYAVALSWTALTPTRTAEAIFDIARATGWDEFRAAAAKFAAPSQNMVYADREGNIGYQAPGLIPVRGPANSGDWPSPGWDPDYDWTGEHVRFAALPSVLNPPEGYVVTANQAPAGLDYPHRLGAAWDYGYRSQRLFDLLGEQERFSPEDMTRIQLDDHHPFAPTLVPHLLAVDPGTPYYRAGQRLLRRWDFSQPADSPAAAYFNAVWRNLLELTFADEVPESVQVNGNARWFEVVRRLLDEPESSWWDHVDTDDVVEERDDVLAQAMRLARDELVQLQARRVDRWTWGHQHTLTLENQTVGQSEIGLVARLLNRGDWEVGGGSSTVNATGWNAEVGYEVNWVPSMRMVVSLDDLDDSTWVNLTGASGHAFHPHYTDQTDLWAQGRTHPWPFSREAVEEAGADVLTLVPTRRG